MLAIDHIVIASRDPEKDALNFGEEFGVQTVPGGKHTNWGTYNYLAYFENNCYIEWIGIFDESLARKSDNPLIKQLVQTVEEDNYGAFTFALRTTRMNDMLEHFNNISIIYEGPFPGKRNRIDGSNLSWRMLFPNEKENMPFLIEWGDSLNLPDERSKINKKTISKVHVPPTFNIDPTIFKTTQIGNMVRLDNGKLEMKHSGALSFEILDA